MTLSLFTPLSLLLLWPLSQTHIYTVLKAALKKADQSSMGVKMHGVMIAIEYSYKLDRKNILIHGAN